ncbi:MAG: hypothetical protein AB7J32_23995 [Pseudonocardia sp.]
MVLVNGAPRLSHRAAAQAELDAVAVVGVARMALTDAALAVLQARLARIQAGEDEADAAAADGQAPGPSSRACRAPNTDLGRLRRSQGDRRPGQHTSVRSRSYR